MATLRDIRNRIKGVQSTQKITKAMKMVAAAKLRRAQDAIINARPFTRKLSEMLKHLVTEHDRETNPFLNQREVKNVLVVVVSAERGLCGAFNTNIIKEASSLYASLKKDGKEPSLYCVGKKGYDFFRKRNYTMTGYKTGVFNGLKYDSALQLSKLFIEGYLNGQFDQIIVVYNEFKSVVSQRVVRETYLPVPVIEASQKGIHEEVDFIYEPGQKDIFERLLAINLKAQFWRILLESNASEFGSRMTAMENATNNARDLIKSLKLTYNKERQAAITKEILEIVSGANALKG
ncbi:MAG: ATP synthase F1 subunit gamma [Ignavibacteriales bacterium]|nr:ATP synthase gamma chain [Ignavibacteriaceae bacterium]QOJ28546.1 MAG: ATP synthase F1 subunit gamma [Ignavibacteriales bacterium]